MDKKFDKQNKFVRENVISIRTEQTTTTNDDIAISGSLSPSLSRTSTDISSLDTAACELSSSALSLSSKPPTPKVRNRFTNVLKSIRPKALVPKRFKSDLSTELPQQKGPLNTPQVSRKSIINNTKTIDGVEKLKKKSRTSSFVKKFSIGKKSKEGPTLEKGNSDPDSASSYIATPVSVKIPTPDVVRQSVSEISLHDISKDVDLTPPQSILQETKQYFTRGAHLRIKISGHKSTVKKPNETYTLPVEQSNSKKQHLELHNEGLAVLIDSGSDAIIFPKASQQTKDIQLPVEANKYSGEIPTVEKQFKENAKLLTPCLLESGHLHSKCKPINTVEGTTSFSLQPNLPKKIDNQVTVDNLEESGINTPNKLIISDSITEKLFKLFTPAHETLKVPKESVNVDNSISPLGITEFIDDNKLVKVHKEELTLFGDNLSKSLMSQKADAVVTKSDTETKSLARSENTLKKQKSEEVNLKSGRVVGGTVSASDTSKSEKSKGAVRKELSPPPNPNRERRPSLKEELEETGVFLPIRSEISSKVVKPERKSPIRSVSVDAKLESSDQVEVTCQQGNNIENPNLSGFKITESYGDSQVIDGASSDLQLVVEPVDIESNIINFNIGKSVRPQQTSLKLTSDSKELASIHYKIPSVDSACSKFSSSHSVDDCTYSSISSPKTTSPDSISPTRSERARRRIAYIDQTTIDFTIDEKEFFENGSREQISSNYLSGLSGDFSTATFDSPDISIDINKIMPPIGTLFIDNADVSAAMSTSSPEKREHLYKILVIGELGTGKTSFIKRYVHQFFSQSYRATIGVDFALKVLNWDQNTIIRLQLWDIAGQERFGNMTRVYYKEAVGAFIVFDVTRSATFEAAIKWKQDLDSKVQLPDGSSIPCILLANKCDQPKQGIVTTPAKMDEYVEENGFAGWFETSAKENINIEDAARALVNKILLNDKILSSGEIIDAERFALDAKNDEATKKNCAC